MERRKLLLGTGAVLTAGLAGRTKADIVDPTGDGNSDFEATDNETDGGDDDDAEFEGRIGDLVEGEDVHLVVESAERTSEINEFVEADEGNVLVVVALAYKNVSDDFHSVSGFLQTRVRDDENYTYDQSLFGTGQALNDGQIAPGEVERGDVVYEIPEEAGGLVLEFDFQLGGLFGDLERATIDLEAAADEFHDLEQDLAIEVHEIGTSIEYEGTTVTVNGSDTATSLGDFAEAEEGNEFVIVDLTVGNDTGEEQYVSTILQMQLKDGNGYSYSEDLGATVALDRAFDQGSPIADGDQRRGQLAYEVEEGTAPLYWVFEFALFAEGDKTFWQVR